VAGILCHDEMETSPMISYVDQTKCSGCGFCVATCPYKAISLVECVSKRTSQGGTAPSETQKQIAYAKDFIKAN